MRRSTSMRFLSYWVEWATDFSRLPTPGAHMRADLNSDVLMSSSLKSTLGSSMVKSGRKRR